MCVIIKVVEEKKTRKNKTARQKGSFNIYLFSFNLDRLCASAFLSYIILSIHRLLGRHGMASAGSSAARLASALALINARSSVGHLRPRRTCLCPLIISYCLTPSRRSLLFCLTCRGLHRGLCRVLRYQRAGAHFLTRSPSKI